MVLFKDPSVIKAKMLESLRILQELPLIKIEKFSYQSVLTTEYRSLVGREGTWVHLAAKEALIVSSLSLGVYP